MFASLRAEHPVGQQAVAAVEMVAVNKAVLVRTKYPTSFCEIRVATRRRSRIWATAALLCPPLSQISRLIPRNHLEKRTFQQTKRLTKPLFQTIDHTHRKVGLTENLGLLAAVTPCRRSRMLTTALWCWTWRAAPSAAWRLSTAWSPSSGRPCSAPQRCRTLTLYPDPDPDPSSAPCARVDCI